jgi:hypothetical protein
MPLELGLGPGGESGENGLRRRDSA